jgi:hypothetical protein
MLLPTPSKPHAKVLASDQQGVGVSHINPVLILEFNMHIYSAYVRANGLVVQTQVCANNLSDAINLLKGMYGTDNLVHLPQLVG